MAKIIAYDLGTGGIKASLFNERGESLASSFQRYETAYPHDLWCEQKPMDWWNGVCVCTKELLEKSGAKPGEIDCAALSGHSIVTVPIGKNGELLAESVPIWCDMRATDVPGDFFREIRYEDWYMTTGNGDPPESYSLFKLMWMKKHQPELFNKTVFVLGSKDFINYRLTGARATDPSYAASFGVFNLKKWAYEDRFFTAAGIGRALFADIIPSDARVGAVTAEAAKQTGLLEGTPVACGGVDNMCMALGACGIGEGKVYTSLGSSSWIAVTTREPILDIETLPFVYAHAVPGYYTSAVSIFSAGNSFRWVHDELLKDVLPVETRFDRMNEMAARVPEGSNGILFNPTLAGGSAQEKSPNTHGSFYGLSLGTTREDLVRASMEGVCFALRYVLDILKKHTNLAGRQMLLCGGGSKSALWRQMFADIYRMEILKTNIDQDAASLGAGALAANAQGIFKGYDMIESFHKTEAVEKPRPGQSEKYEALYAVYREWSESLAWIGDKMQKLHARGIW